MELQEGSDTAPCSGSWRFETEPRPSSSLPSGNDNVESAVLEVPAKYSNIRILRRRALDFARNCPLGTEDLADIELAVGEACSNAVRHGSPKGELNSVILRCLRTDSAIVFEVSDFGPGFDPQAVPDPVVDNPSEGSLGIFVMQAVMDKVEFVFNHGTTVRLLKRYTRQPEEKN